MTTIGRSAIPILAIATAVAPSVATAQPLKCPKRTVARGAVPPDGFAAWCERPGGLKDGPYMYWFASGKKMRAGKLSGGQLDGTQTVWNATGIAVETRLLAGA